MRKLQPGSHRRATTQGHGGRARSSPPGLLAAACGGGDKDEAEGTPVADGFPVTIEHRFGSVTLTEAPVRVVSVGYHEQDPILALGVKPVAVREWFGEQPYATWPWAQDELGDAQPEVLTGELNLERIAGLRPDLIVALSALLDQAQYDSLAKIAPTLVEPAEYVGFGMPWQEITRTIGRALGQEDRADAMVAEVEGGFAEARAAHPEFAGKTAVAAYDFGPASFGFYGPQDPRARFLSALGFQLPPPVADLVKDEFFAEISDEQVGVLSADLLVWLVFLEGGVKSRLEGNPVYPTLDVAKQGRDVFLRQDDVLQAAYGFSTVLSLPTVLDDLVPRIAAAVDGDASTKVPGS